MCDTTERGRTPMDRNKILIAMQERRDLHYLAVDEYQKTGKWELARKEHNMAAGITEAIAIYLSAEWSEWIEEKTS